MPKADVDVLVVGEALVDEVGLDDADVSHPGGSPYNVAVGLARLGIRTVLHTAIGADERGALLRDHAQRSGLLSTAESVTADPTSFARARIDHTGAALYDFTVAWRPAPLVAAVTPRLVHTGSIAAVLAPGNDLVEREITARSDASLISLDPNVRPQLTPDRDDARARLERLVARADVVKVSDEDLAWLYPGRDADEIATAWVGSSPALVVVTRGAAGATGFSAAGRHLPVKVSVEVADTIGAGDSFMSGLLFALLETGVSASGERLRGLDRGQIDRALGFAARCAAITVGRAGAEPPWRGEVAAVQ